MEDIFGFIFDNILFFVLLFIAAVLAFFQVKFVFVFIDEMSVLLAFFGFLILNAVILWFIVRRMSRARK